MSDERVQVERQLRAAMRHLRAALKLAREVSAHHGVDTWAEIDWPEAAETAAWLAADVGKARQTVDQLDAALRRDDAA